LSSYLIEAAFIWCNPQLGPRQAFTGIREPEK